MGYSMGNYGIFCTKKFVSRANLSSTARQVQSTKPRATSAGFYRFCAPGGVCIGSADLHCLTHRSGGGTQSMTLPAPETRGHNHTAEQDDRMRPKYVQECAVRDTFNTITIC